MGPPDEAEARIHELEEDVPDHDEGDREFLRPEPGQVVLSNPKPPLRLGYFSVFCIICNRMIGEHLSLNITAMVVSWSILL